MYLFSEIRLEIISFPRTNGRRVVVIFNKDYYCTVLIANK